jgi:UDP-N-acetylmuramyl pentapeptide phosphotransferase/UDP-N-acetylglucosamine-1-phosphate transferase
VSSAASWTLIALVAFAAALAGVLLVEQQAARLGLVDLPNTRSSHVKPRPRGGGLGIVVAVWLGAALAAGIGLSVDPLVWIVLAASTIVGLVGLVDDVRGVGILPRLAVQAVAASVVVTTVGAFGLLPLPAPADVPLGWLSPILTVIWLVGVTNFFNFMDGLDGLAGGQAVITLAAFAIVAWPNSAGAIALVAASATVGFLLRNWSPARIFLGDVGSAFLGFLMAALPLVPRVGGSNSLLVLMVATSLALFLFDPVATLMLRAQQGAKLGASHRQHAYQQFVAVGTSHAPVVARLLLVALGLSLAAIGAYWHNALAWPAVGVAALAFASEWLLAARHRQRSA